jgi:hypothetical protein
MSHQDCGRKPAPIEDRTSSVRDQNDAFRHTFVGGLVMGTHGFDALAHELKGRFITALREFDDFEAGNDPYAEHDFGAITIDEVKVFWKIDYYDQTMEAGSPDPADPRLTMRILTVMLAHEY